MPYKPKLNPSVSPYLMAKDAPALIDFLSSVFGAEITRRYDTDDGAIKHVEIRIGDGIVMIGQARRDLKPVIGWVHIYVPDAHAVHQIALQNGATEMFPVSKEDDDPDIRGGFIDPWGNTWFAATEITDARANA